MDILTFIVLALATWRISSLAVSEDGPWHVLERTRNFLGLKDLEVNGVTFKQPKNMIAEMLTCVWCTSVWVGAGLTLFYALSGGLAFWFCLPLALSALAIVIQEHV